MDPEYQWLITTIISIIALLAGRYWAFHDRLINHDQKTINKIKEILPYEGSITFIRFHDFGNSFEYNKLKDLIDYKYFSINPEFHFIDKNLEDVRKDLVIKILGFDDYISLHTWLINSEGGQRSKMKNLEEFSSANEYESERKRINDLSDMIWQQYDKLINLANKKGL